ncbi:hypothetical protein M1N58_00030 [Dehalococcoidales bacterium]|nr:hypothetical protein [Dehalococcoidales bacterium]
MYYIADAVEIQAITEDKNSKVIKCALVISELEREVLLSDQTIDELEIVLNLRAKGYGGLGTKLRLGILLSHSIGKRALSPAAVARNTENGVGGERK